MKALSKNPSNRYQSADEFSADLARVIAGQEVEATPLMPPLVGDATQVISRPSSHTAVLPPAEEPEGSGRKVWLGVLIGLLLFALLAGGGYLLVSSLTGDDNGGTTLDTVEIDDYEGERFVDAKSQIEDLDLEVARENQETRDPTDVGTVIAQSPAPGTPLNRGEGTVTLTVGVAPDTVQVPELAGMTVSEAQQELETNDLTLGSPIPAASIEFAEGEVIRSEPASGEEVEPGRAIDVFVSTGPETVIVPDVSTGCLSLGGANKILREAGLVRAVGDAQPSTPDCPNPNRIIGQDPLAGETVEAGSTVTVFPGGGGDV